MTGTNCDLFTHKQSRSYLNHLVHEVHRILQWRNTIKVLYNSIIIFIHKTFIYRVKGKCKCFFNATSNFALSFMRIDKLILFPSWKQAKLAFGLCKWCLFLVLKLHITQIFKLTHCYILFSVNLDVSFLSYSLRRVFLGVRHTNRIIFVKEKASQKHITR